MDASAQETGVSGPILINGAGPVGLTMACELARHAVPFRIFDKNPAAATQSRALAIFPRTLEVFSSLGVLDQILAEGQKLNAITLSSGDKELARLNFESVDSPYPFAISLPQSRTERILEARLHALGGKVERENELVGLTQDARGVHAMVHGMPAPVDGSWMLGCDGAHSTVRHALGFRFQGAQYDEEFLLADVRVASDLPTDQAHLFFARDGILAIFPFGGGRGRVIASERVGETHAGQEPDLQEIQEIVTRRCKHPVTVSDSVWSAWFHISHRMVDHYGQGRVILAGDAAHIHSPAGGQGMNTGIQDAFNLGWKIAEVARGLLAPEILASYEEERMPVAKAVVNLTDRMTRAATAQNSAMQQLRDLLVPMLSGIHFVKEAMVERLAEVAIDYRGCAWVENHGLGPVRAGDRAPDALFFDRPAKTERRLFELLRAPGWLLLIFEGRDDHSPGEAGLGGLPGSLWRVIRPGREAAPGTLEDRDCLARSTYGATEAGLLVLIRPDGYVGFRGENTADLAAYTARLTGKVGKVAAKTPVRAASPAR